MSVMKLLGAILVIAVLIQGCVVYTDPGYGNPSGYYGHGHYGPTRHYYRDYDNSYGRRSFGYRGYAY